MAVQAVGAGVVKALAEIVVDTDGGPWADHNMPCAVCRQRAAVLNLNTGRFQPCWGCQEDGWETTRHRGFLRRAEEA